jgi:hypothetical protein
MHANPLPTFSLTILVVFAITAQAGTQKLVTFDAPNSSTNPFQGTEAAGINIWGTIVGDVTDSDGGVHGFARTADGKFTEFDVLGANPARCRYCCGRRTFGYTVNYTLVQLRISKHHAAAEAPERYGETSQYRGGLCVLGAHEVSSHVGGMLFQNGQFQ